MISSSFADKLFKFMSTKTGLNPFFIIETISEIQVKAGTITSPFLYNSFSAAKVIKFAEEPEFTKTLYLTPNHLDHFFSNSNTFLF